MATNISHRLKVHSESLGGKKITYRRKSVFCSAFGFSDIAFIIPSHFIITSAIFNSLNGVFLKTIRVLNSLDSDQARHYVGSDLGPNCLQRLSVDDKSRC